MNTACGKGHTFGGMAHAPRPFRLAVNARWLLADSLEGTGWYSHRLLERLCATPGWEVHLFFDRYVEGFDYPGAVKHVVGLPARHPWLWKLWNERSVPWLLCRIKADAYWSPDGLLPSRRALKRVGLGGLPLAVTVHDLNFVHQPEGIPPRVGQYYQSVVSRGVAEANLLFTVSQTSKNDLAATYGADLERIVVTPNAPQQDFKPLANVDEARRRWAGGHPYFVFVGAFTPRKNVATLIRAFQTFKTRHPERPEQLVLVGNPLHRDAELEQLSRTAGPAVHWVGRAEGSDLNALYSGAVAFCFPSKFEGFGIPLIEAMASGCPVLSSTASCMPEIAGDAARYAAPDDADAWAELLYRAATEDPHEWVQRGLAQAARYDWDRSAAAARSALETLRPAP
ncbi:MAG: glycosyltransferase family 4 protein [Bacteroidetes bacterium]|nr:glycosyltransferase family 4 protein [Bacteroidota bacterium]